MACYQESSGKWQYLTTDIIGELYGTEFSHNIFHAKMQLSVKSSYDTI